MTDETAFLEAILDAPENQMLRIVYSDWLEERGGAERLARAEFLRVQVQLINLGEGDPGRQDLDTRLLDLLAKHARLWLGPVYALTGEPPPWDEPKDWDEDAQRSLAGGYLQRGFVRVGCTAEQLLANGQALLPITWLVRVETTGGDVWLDEDFAQHLADCPFLRLVTRIRTGHWPAMVLESLVRSPHLVNLTELELRDNGEESDDDDVAIALAANPALGRLRAISWPYSLMFARGIIALATSPTLVSLSSLELHYNNNDLMGCMSESKQAALTAAIRVWEQHRGYGFSFSGNS